MRRLLQEVPPELHDDEVPAMARSLRVGYHTFLFGYPVLGLVCYKPEAMYLKQTVCYEPAGNITTALGLKMAQGRSCLSTLGPGVGIAQEPKSHRDLEPRQGSLPRLVGTIRDHQGYWGPTGCY